MTETCAKATAAPFGGQVAYGYWETLCQALRAAGLEVPAQTSQESAVTVEQYLSWFELGLRKDPAFGIEVGRSVSLKTFPVLGMTLLSCGTLEQALTQILRYESLNHDLGRSELDLGSDRCRFRWSANPRFLPVPDSEISYELALSVFAGIKTFAPLLLQKELPITRLDFISGRPDTAQKVEAFFQCPVHYGQPDNAIEVRPDMMEWQLNFGDPTTFAALTAHADALLAEVPHQQEFVRRIQTLLPDALRKQAFRIEDIAHTLNLSARSVQRKLKEQGHNYQRLLDETRQTLAKSYLKENKLPMSEIAFLIGYQEQSSFNHAFKGWTGQSPSDYRANSV